MAYKEVLFGWTHNGYNPISVGWKQHTDNQMLQPVICEYYTLYYILAGTGEYTINHIEHRASKGDLITCIPGDIFSFRDSDNNPVKHIWITFAICGNVENRFLHSYLKAPYLQEVFEKLPNMVDINSQQYVRECIVEISRLTQSDSNSDAMLVYRATKYINEQSHNIELKVTDLAENLGVTKFKLIRAFHNVKDMPPIECIIRCRLEKACEYIRTQKYNLSEISVLAGYKNYSTFEKIFKKYYDITPNEYRKKCMKH